jgi:hypothetical protein
MGITNNAIVVVRPPAVGISEWAISMYSADLSGCEELLAAVTGKSHYITKLAINTIASITVSIGAGETSDALTNTYIGPIGFTAAGPNFILDFGLGQKSMKLPVSTAFCVDASGAGATSVYAEGITV